MIDLESSSFQKMNQNLPLIIIVVIAICYLGIDSYEWMQLKMYIYMYILAFQGPMGPEMLALWLAFWANFVSDEPTHRFMYIDITCF